MALLYLLWPFRLMISVIDGLRPEQHGLEVQLLSPSDAARKVTHGPEWRKVQT